MKDSSVSELQIPDFVEINGAQRPTRDSLGRFIRSNVEDIKAFYVWFGDSMVTDVKGRPLIAFHGSHQDLNLDAETSGTPTFFTSDSSAAEYYASWRSDYDDHDIPVGGRITPVYLKIQNALSVKTQSEAMAFIDIARRAGVEITVIDGYGGWEFETDEIRQHSEWDGDNLNDLVYSPRVREQLLKEGYDGLNVEDTLENTSIPTWITLDCRQISFVVDNCRDKINDNIEIHKVSEPRRPATDNELAPEIRIDIPSERWLSEKIMLVERDGRNEFGVPSLRIDTATFRNGKPVLIPIDMLVKVKGMQGEEYAVRHEDLHWLKDSMSKTGLLPLRENNSEYLPLILIGYDGEPWINEGNHRIKAAAELGFNYLPVEVRYFEGGERKGGDWSPESLIKMHNEIVQSGLPRISGELGESIIFAASSDEGLVEDHDDNDGLTL